MLVGVGMRLGGCLGPVCWAGGLGLSMAQWDPDKGVIAGASDLVGPWWRGVQGPVQKSCVWSRESRMGLTNPSVQKSGLGECFGPCSTCLVSYFSFLPLPEHAVWGWSGLFSGGG